VDADGAADVGGEHMGCESEECESCGGEHGVEMEADELRIAWIMLCEDDLRSREKSYWFLVVVQILECNGIYCMEVGNEVALSSCRHE
jgi:hypothetical protein